MTPCAVALVLLLDASGSVSGPEWDLQVAGHAAAFDSPAIVRVIDRGEVLAVTAMEFSDIAQPLVPWALLRSGADAAAFAQAMRRAPRLLSTSTDIGSAITAGLASLQDAPCAADQQVIDVVSDGGAEPRATEAARDAAFARGVRVNALGVGRLPGGDPADWLREHAATPGGFTLSAAGWGDFADAIRRKITMEVAAW